MLLLVIVGLVGAVASEPQTVLPMGYNIMSLHNGQSILPYAYSPIPGTYMPSGIIPSSSGIIPTSSGIIPTSSGIIPMGHNIIYPSLDITMARSSSPMTAKPVEDTPEVKKAKMDFEMAYSKALMGTPETQVFRARRDVNRVMPYGYSLPYSGYMTPYGQLAHPIPSSPVVSSNVYHSPYVTHY